MSSAWSSSWGEDDDEEGERSATQKDLKARTVPQKTIGNTQRCKGLKVHLLKETCIQLVWSLPENI